MNTRARRTGRQIPEYIVICLTLSLSVIIGAPIMAHWRVRYPELPNWLGLIGAIGVGFLFLVGLVLAVIGVERFVVWLSDKRSGKS